MMVTERITELRKAIKELNEEKRSLCTYIEGLLEIDDDVDELIENGYENISLIDDGIFEHVDMLERYKGMLATYGENAKLW